AGGGGGVVRGCARAAPGPPGGLFLVDRGGGQVRAWGELPPAESAHAVRRKARAYAAGRATGGALRRTGVHVDLAPVLDLPDGPLGARPVRSPLFRVSLARGLAPGGAGARPRSLPR